jgi:hypothetical protein
MELTAEEKNAIEFYIHGGNYSEVNIMLRDGRYDIDTAEIIENMDSAFEKSEASEDMVVFRNFGDFEFKVGDSFEDKAFASTTTDIQVARQWPGKMIGRIKIEKLDKCLPGNEGEKEIILPRGLNFDVIGIGPDGIYEIEKW